MAAVPACPICRAAHPRARARTPLLTVLRCAACGLHFVPGAGRPTAVAGDYYEALDLEDYVAYYEPFRLRVFRENWRRIAAWRAGGEALDFGASFGWFLRAAPPGWRVRGLEPAEAVAARGRAGGLAIETGGEAAFAADSRRYDLVTLWNVLEHLPEPRRALATLHKRLRPGGLVALCIPSRLGLYNRLAYLAYDASRGRIAAPLHTLFQVRNPAPHRFHFAPRDVRRLLAETGFEVLAAHGQPIVDLGRLALRARLEPDSGGLAGHAAGRGLMFLVYHLSRLLQLPDEVAMYARRGGAD
jgi:SAM-dependent methyltransferase